MITYLKEIGCSGLIQLRKGTSGTWSFRFNKKLEIS
jgi:hypothetical protein